MAYTTIDKSSDYFDTKLHTGTGGSKTLAYDFEVDFYWTKMRNDAYPHNLFDSSRGNNALLRASQNNTEVSAANTVSFGNASGITLGSDGSSYGVNQANNDSGSSATFVGFAWKANGGTTSSNSSGSITSTVQASTTAGFSIVTYTGNGSQGATIGHGLGVVPNVVLVKGRSIGDSWTMLHTGIASDFQTDMIKLDENGAAQDNSVFWNDTAPTSSVFTVDGAGGETKVNANGYTYVTYCFANIQGYSKFGSYTGNGNVDGPFVYLGFKPAWLLIKETGNTNEWRLFDNKRSPINQVSIHFESDTNLAETDGGTSYNGYDFLSNGFKVRTSNAGNNRDGGTYIYMAFAEHPFVSSKGVPTTAR
jgi:hypothetical protein